MEEQRIILHNGDNAALARDVTIVDTTTWNKQNPRQAHGHGLLQQHGINLSDYI
jgi:hypothetical protein